MNYRQTKHFTQRVYIYIYTAIIPVTENTRAILGQLESIVVLIPAIDDIPKLWTSKLEGFKNRELREPVNLTGLLHLKTGPSVILTVNVTDDRSVNGSEMK